MELCKELTSGDCQVGVIKDDASVVKVKTNSTARKVRTIAVRLEKPKIDEERNVAMIRS